MKNGPLNSGEFGGFFTFIFYLLSQYLQKTDGLFGYIIKILYFDLRSKVLTFDNKNKRLFILYCAHFFVLLRQ